MIRTCDQGHASLDAANWQCPWCEIERLTAQLENMKNHHKVAVDGWTLEAQTVKQLEDEAHELRARVAELEKDAARYRWLRNAAPWPWVRYKLWMPISGAEFDAIVDAAIKGGSGNE